MVDFSDKKKSGLHAENNLDLEWCFTLVTDLG